LEIVPDASIAAAIKARYCAAPADSNQLSVQTLQYKVNLYGLTDAANYYVGHWYTIACFADTLKYTPTHMQFSTRTKLFLSHFLAVVLVSGSIGSYFYASAIDNLKLSLQSRLMNSAAILSEVFSAESMSTLNSAADMQTPQYQALLERIRRVAGTNPDIAFVYVMRKVGDKVVFVLDSDAQPARPGEIYQQHIPELLQGFNRPSVDRDITSDKWGSFLSGYAPLHDAHGDYLVGVDMYANEVEHKMRQLKQAGVTSLVVSLLLAVLFANVLAKHFNVRIHRLGRRCGEIARTQLEPSRDGGNGDELDRLGQTIEAMAQHLELSREENEHARRALERHKNELEQRVQQRTGELLEANDQLREEIKERERIEAVLQQTARTDYLTQLPNRRAMIQILDKEAARFQRAQHPFSLVLLDIDHFKSINDSFGHDGGDEILVSIAEHMRGWMREKDVLARWGGEEFLILLSDTDVDRATEQAERLRAAIEAQTFNIQQGDTRITASLGVAGYTGHQGIDSCIKDADVALYRAKSGGRNRVITHRCSL
jgi:diguanylate cyclase (GGDEF)-like protein